MPVKILEKHIESRLCRKLKAGGCLCEKFTSPQKRSVPDRLVTAPGGAIYFVELKAPGKKPTEAQARDHGRRRDLGCVVYVLDTYEAVDQFVDEVLINTIL